MLQDVITHAVSTTHGANVPPSLALIKTSTIIPLDADTAHAAKRTKETRLYIYVGGDLTYNRYKMAKSLHRVRHFEAVRVATAVEKRSRWKVSTSQSESVSAAESSDTGPFTCDDCGRQFTARTNLVGPT